MASVDDADTNRRFAEANGARFPVLADPDKEVAAAYGVLLGGLFAKRWTFYIDGEGHIAYIDKDVQPLSAARDMLERLAALGVPKRP